MRTTICLILLISVISIYGYFALIENYNIKSCEFVCSHLYKTTKLDADDSYRFDYYLPNTSLIEGKVKHPYPIHLNGTPYICPCSFRVEVLENASDNRKLYDIKELVYVINYSDWKKWWTN